MAAEFPGKQERRPAVAAADVEDARILRQTALTGKQQQTLIREGIHDAMRLVGDVIIGRAVELFAHPGLIRMLCCHG